MIYLKYFLKVVKHKWYVFWFGLKLRVPIYLLILHDWSKFLPSEFIPYAKHFGGIEDDKTNLEFDIAWLHHQHRNKHHWQYWILVRDIGSVLCMEMPECYARELVADWMGASAVYGNHVQDWYLGHKNVINMNTNTRIYVEILLGL